jgi:hypothetical protein
VVSEVSPVAAAARSAATAISRNAVAWACAAEAAALYWSTPRSRAPDLLRGTESASCAIRLMLSKSLSNCRRTRSLLALALFSNCANPVPGRYSSVMKAGNWDEPGTIYLSKPSLRIAAAR